MSGFRADQLFGWRNSHAKTRGVHWFPLYLKVPGDQLSNQHDLLKVHANQSSHQPGEEKEEVWNSESHVYICEQHGVILVKHKFDQFDPFPSTHQAGLTFHLRSRHIIHHPSNLETLKEVLFIKFILILGFGPELVKGWIF